MPLQYSNRPIPIRWKTSRKRRWLLALGLLVLAGGAFILWSFVSGRGELQQAIREIEKDDPYWRIEDMIAARANVPDSENSALQITMAKALIDKSVQDHEFDSSAEEKLNSRNEFPAALANVEQQGAIFDLLKPHRPALAEFRRLAEMRNGRFPLKISPDFIGTLLNSQDARVGANTLRYDLCERLEQNDVAGAAIDLHGLINSSRSIGDEPFLISFLIRVATEAIAIQGFEHFFAQTEPDETTLAGLQRALEIEVMEQLLTMAFRGERAGCFACLEHLKRQPKNLNGLMSLAGGGGGGGGGGQWQMIFAYVPGWMGVQQASVLRMTSEAVAISQKPVEEQLASFQEYTKKVPTMSMLAQLLCPAMGKVAGANVRRHAKLRSAIVAVAAERYRLQHGKWPDRIEDLVAAKLIDAVPLDPYDVQPLRWITTAEGRIIYSVGEDRIDNGGVYNFPKPQPTGNDMIFRLYDPDKRRQPPRPPLTKEEMPTDGPGG